QQLLSFARQQPLKTENYNLNTLITNFDPVLRRAGHSRITFRFDLSEKLPAVVIDAARFEAALLNLVVNARDAMPDGGLLTISTEVLMLRDREIGTLGAGRYVKVSVADTGMGLSQDVAARAMEPFFTTKEMGKGTGLGLS